MAYVTVHKRKILGKQIHETISGKRKRLEDRKKLLLPNQNQDALKEVQREEVESKYLVPEIQNWVETEATTALKTRIKNWLSLGYPVHIIGPTGCGKTTMALQIAKEQKRPVVWINGDESITTTDLIGGYSQVEVESIRDKYIHNVFKDKDILKADWIDNPLTLACKYGYTLVYNEFSRSKANANNILLSIFSENTLELPTLFGKERYIKVHPDFRVIFTSNSIEYAGIHTPQDALLDRMVGIYMDYYDTETEARIIAAQSRISEEQALQIVKILHALRVENPEEFHLGTRAGVMIAQALKSTKDCNKETIEHFFGDVITSKTKNFKHLIDQMKILKRVCRL